MGGSLLHGSYFSIHSCSNSNFLTPSQALSSCSAALIGVVIAKLETHISHSPPTLRGYIAMLAVTSEFRNCGIATALVRQVVDAMVARGADEVVLETEETNIPAMKLYERLGFIRSKKLHRYYLNGNSAYRLVLPLKTTLEMSGKSLIWLLRPHRASKFISPNISRKKHDLLSEMFTVLNFMKWYQKCSTCVFHKIKRSIRSLHLCMPNFSNFNAKWNTSYTKRLRLLREEYFTNDHAFTLLTKTTKETRTVPKLMSAGFFRDLLSIRS